MKCVLFAVNVCLCAVKCSSSNAQNTLQPSCQIVKRRIMTIASLEVLIKFGASEMICVS